MLTLGWRHYSVSQKKYHCEKISSKTTLFEVQLKQLMKQEVGNVAQSASLTHCKYRLLSVKYDREIKGFY